MITLLGWNGFTLSPTSIQNVLSRWICHQHTLVDSYLIERIHYPFKRSNLYYFRHAHFTTIHFTSFVANASTLQTQNKLNNAQRTKSAEAAVVAKTLAHCTSCRIMSTRPFAGPAIQLVLFDRQTLAIAASACLLFILPTIGTCPLVSTVMTMEGSKVTTHVLSTDTLPWLSTITVKSRRRNSRLGFGLAQVTSRKGRKQVTTKERVVPKIIVEIIIRIKIKVSRISCRPFRLRVCRTSTFGLSTIGSVELSCTLRFLHVSNDGNQPFQSIFKELSSVAFICDW